MFRFVYKSTTEMRCCLADDYDQVKRKIAIQYDYLGEHEVKNIDEPVRVYKVLMDSIPYDVLPKKNSEGKISIEKKTSASSEKPSIVVLPFVNMSNDPEQEYFSDGMSEEIINALAKLEGLKVISRTSAFFFKGKDVNVRTIGQELKVEHVLEGSVRKAGSKLRITAQLIKVADDTHLWSDAYNRELEDVFAIQGEISTAIVGSLKIHLLDKEKKLHQKIYTENIEAYEAYIKGRYYWYSFIEGGLEKALYYYNQAIAFDPDYAPAYSAIAEYYWGLPFMEPKVSNNEVYTKAREAIKTALKIDNNFSEAHATLGLIQFFYEWDSKDAEKAYKTAINLNPGLSKPHYDYALYLACTGNTQKSISEARKAVELDPFSGHAHVCLGFSFFTSGKFDQALRELQHALEMMPTHLPCLILLPLAYVRRGMFEEAIEEINKGLEIYSGNPSLLRNIGHINALRGEKKKTRKILDELIKRSKKEYVTPFAIASLYADLGENDKVYEYLEKGYEKRDIYFIFSIIEYGNAPPFDAFYKKIGLRG